LSDVLSFIPFLVAVVAIAASGAVFRPGEWYLSLDKPWWTPPSWLFAPAWSVLYLMIAIAGWLVWKQAGFGLAFGFWILNLAANAAWSWLMFGRRQMALALVDAIAMLITILAFIRFASPISPAAAWLFVPYLAWVTFASALNLSLLLRNRATRF
jgi:tryptophan-rich sensory protein